jgi:hypothetical protein
MVAAMVAALILAVLAMAAAAQLIFDVVLMA